MSKLGRVSLTLGPLLPIVATAGMLGCITSASAETNGTMQPEHLSALLALAAENGSARVIVELDVEALEPGLSRAETRARLTAIAEAQAVLTQAFGTEAVNRTYATIPMVAMTLDAAQLRQLHEMDGIAAVHVDGMSAPNR